MKKNKAPGLGGFTTEFFQATWSFMGIDILEVVEESRRNQKVCHGLNATFITLIPKSSKSEDPQGFRPISLCNVIYKIIVNLISKRLKPLLPNIISPEQTGFVKGSKILDGLVTSQEVVHSLKINKVVGMLVKLDLSKASDRLIWEYIRSILRAYDFNHRWINWISAMISTPVFLSF